MGDIKELPAAERYFTDALISKICALVSYNYNIRRITTEECQLDLRRKLGKLRHLSPIVTMAFIFSHNKQGLVTLLHSTRGLCTQHLVHWRGMALFQVFSQPHFVVSFNLEKQTVALILVLQRYMNCTFNVIR